MMHGQTQIKVSGSISVSEQVVQHCGDYMDGKVGNLMDMDRFSNRVKQGTWCLREE